MSRADLVLRGLHIHMSLQRISTRKQLQISTMVPTSSVYPAAQQFVTNGMSISKRQNRRPCRIVQYIVQVNAS